MPWVNEVRGRNWKRVNHDSDPNRRRLVASLGPLHYESVPDSGVWDSEVDLSLKRVQSAALNGWMVDTNGWHFAYQGFSPVGGQPAQGTLAFGGRQGQHWIGLRPLRVGYLRWNQRTPEFVGGAPTFSTPSLIEKEKTIGINDADPHTWTMKLGMEANMSNLWTTPGGGSVSWQIRANSGQLRQEFVINQAGREWIENNAPPSTPAGQTWFGMFFALEWRNIPRARLKGVLQDIASGDFEDDADGGLQLEDDAGRVLGEFMPDHIFVRSGGLPVGGRVVPRRRFYFDGTNWFMFVGANVRDMNQNLLPGDLVIDPAISQEQISGNFDDATQGGSTMYRSGQYDKDNMGYSAYNTWHSGFRFQTVPIPNAATINSASITVYRVSGGLYGSPTMDIYCEDGDSPGQFTNSNNNISGRTRTTAKTAWNGGFGSDSSDVQSPDIAGAVEEVVARAGWSSNNDLVVLVISTTGGGGNNIFQVEDFNAAGTNHARFDASYTAAGGGANPKGVLGGLVLGGPFGGPIG